MNKGIVLGLAASALATQGRTLEAAATFEAAAILADATEALHRSIAMTGNNLAVSLEQRVQRSPEEDTLMLRAAQVARVFWGRAGTWLNVERAEYRLAMTRLGRGEAVQAADCVPRVADDAFRSFCVAARKVLDATLGVGGKTTTDPSKRPA
ncbi:MAG: hypothetical protein Q8P18_16085 [Pseudomonadota bacterium]|nr:hypothetical protein [Pseudomonadota bacterium]